ncbi:hypothetical protein BDN70DRAFT_876033, partial [Pholiota conissans]
MSKPKQPKPSEDIRNSSGSVKTLLPGFGRPLNYLPSKTEPDYVGNPLGSALNFTHIENQCSLPLTTVREFVMLQFMNSITDNPAWHLEVNNPEIGAKWKQEALAFNREDLTEKMVDYCLDELRYKSTLIPPLPVQPPPIVVYNGDVVKSDTALSSEFKGELQQTIKKFEASITEKHKDWRPGCDGKVWDLVSPSLYPLVYGRTRILDNESRTTLNDCINRSGEGQLTEVPTEDESKESGGRRYGEMRAPYSRKFQWLPCEVDISGVESVRITSYINNLHPEKEKLLYRMIENVIDASIPLWNLTLAPQTAASYNRYHRRIWYPGVNYEGETEAGRVYWDETAEGIDWDTRPFIRPEPEAFTPFNASSTFSLREKYEKSGLQVIVELINIELTSEKPQYDGGPWHIEGQLNEHIVATAFYYYSDSNITTSSITFRQWFDEEDTVDLYYKPPYFAWCPVIYGCREDGPRIQDVGGVETREGRLLTFPNILQHRVGPFKLADPTKPGHRKIIALYLVDPNIKVISTAHVPCQQQEWWWDRVAERVPGSVGLPRELQGIILKDVDFPLSFEEAKALKEELVDERKKMNVHRWEVFEDLATFHLDHGD